MFVVRYDDLYNGYFIFIEYVVIDVFYDFYIFDDFFKYYVLVVEFRNGIYCDKEYWFIFVGV